MKFEYAQPKLINLGEGPLANGECFPGSHDSGTCTDSGLAPGGNCWAGQSAPYQCLGTGSAPSGRCNIGSSGTCYNGYQVSCSMGSPCCTSGTSG
jgi:hypothetical protein